MPSFQFQCVLWACHNLMTINTCPVLFSSLTATQANTQNTEPKPYRCWYKLNTPKALQPQHKLPTTVSTS